jgi:regulatory protein
MARITEITKQKKGNRFNIFVDGEFTVGVSADTLAEFNLYKDKEFILENLKEIISYDFRHIILQKALRVIEASLKTEKELVMRLKDEVYKTSQNYSIEINSEEVIREIVENLKTQGYINDEKYAKEFISSRLANRPRSKDMLKLELMGKGVPKEIVNELLGGIDFNEHETAKELLLKKYHSERIEKKENKKINFLRGKGYNWDIISKFIKDDFEE